MGIAAVALRADAHPGQKGFRPLPHLAPLPAGPVGRQGVGQVIADRQQRVEPGHRVLEHQPHRFTAQLAQGRPGHLAGVLTR